MQIKEIIKELEYYNGKFPKKAIIEARKSKELIIPELLDSLDYVNKNAEKLYEESNSYYLHMYALFLLSEFREKRAFPIIVEILKKDEDVIEFLLGDVITEDVNKILASTFDGNMDMLLDLIEDKNVYKYVRNSAINSLHILLNNNVIDREFMKKYIQKLLDSLSEDDIELPVNIEDIVIEGKFFEFKENIKEFYDRELINLEITGGYDEFLKYLNDKRYVPRDIDYITDTIKEMSTWYCFNQNNGHKKIEKTVEISNSKKKIGRNEPCPCGSGKKYKKCCIKNS